MPRLGGWRRASSDRGFTLVEVLVAMTLLTIVIALTTKSLIGVIDQQSNLTQQTSAQNRNNTGLEFASRMLRQGVYPTGGTYKNSTIINAATATAITFTTRPSSTGSAVNGCTATTCTTHDSSNPVQNYTIALPSGGTTLMWGKAAEIQPCSGVCTYSSPTANAPLISGVRNGGGTAVCPNNTTGTGVVFRYFYTDVNGNQAEYTSFPLTATQLGNVQYVEIDLYTQTQSGPMKPSCVALSSRVELRNWL